MPHACPLTTTAFLKATGRTLCDPRQKHLDMPTTHEDKTDLGGPSASAMDTRRDGRLGLMSGVYIPVCLNIMSILMFLRFGLIVGQVGFLGILGTIVTLRFQPNIIY